MNGELFDATTQAAIDAAWLLGAIAPASAHGENVAPIVSDPAAVVRDARDLAPAKAAAALDAICGAPDIASALARASAGDALDDAALLEIARFCRGSLDAEAALSGYAIGIDLDASACREVERELAPGKAGTYGFYLDERFDPSLGAARERARGAAATFEAARGRSTRAIAAALGRDEIGDDEFVLMRADAPATLPHGLRVIREAPTYLLCSCELDESALAALAHRDAAVAAQAEAERAVRKRLSAFVARHAVALDRAAAALGALDRHLARVAFARDHGCVVAEEGDGIAFEAARFLPLVAELEREGRSYAPISLDLASVAVLTGPNMGGKSVALRTCGFLAFCVALGLPVPARRARIARFDRIAWLGIAADREGGGLLSSFAREVVRLREILERPEERTLVLVDEFARTTTPHEGRALLVATIARLRERGATGLIATHLAGVAKAAGVRHFAIRGLRATPPPPEDGDLSEALAALADAMDYTLAEVTADAPPQTDALALAELLGLDPALVRAAHAHLRE